MPPPDLDRQLARQLHRTWPAFFQRFGRLTPVQRIAIPLILEGQSLLVASATASGKTEAACAPLLERQLARHRPGTILYVSPTRALVNDLYERLAGPLSALSLRLARRTGEHKNAVEGEPHVLITTPESFDSLLCRGRRPDGHVLANVRSIVLDEIHLLDGTARGEHVRWLLERLRRVRVQAQRHGWSDDAAVQVMALSATVANPQRVRDRFLPDGEFVVVRGHRELSEVAVPEGASTLVDAVVKHVLQERADQKIIVFANQRKRVDELAKAFHSDAERVGARVHAHHGSLAQGVREEAEDDLKEGERVLVVATSTLEIGIDVGNIDLIVLDGPAPDIPALLQRMGRGNRRTGTTRLMAWPNSAMEQLVHTAMLDAARSGWMGQRESGPEFAVILQQYASYVFQSHTRRRSTRSLASLSAAMSVERQGAAILDGMVKDELLVRHGKGVALGSALRDQSAAGDIHSTIQRTGGANVVDAGGGGEIATGVRYLGGPTLGVGGRNLRVERESAFSIEVRRIAEDGLATGDWRYVTGPWMRGAGQPQAFRRWIGLKENEWPLLTIDGQSCLFHFGGARRRALLDLVDGPTFGVGNAWFVAVTLPAGEVQRTLQRGVGRGSLRSAVLDRLAQLEDILGRPRINRKLPEDVRTDEIVGWLDVDTEMTQWLHAEIVAPPNSGAAAALELLGRSVRRGG